MEKIVQNCKIRQENSPLNRKQPLIYALIFRMPFKKIACDILEHKVNNYLVVIDYYSERIELIKLKGETLKKRIFTTFGYPQVIPNLTRRIA